MIGPVQSRCHEGSPVNRSAMFAEEYKCSFEGLQFAESEKSCNPASDI